MALPNIFITFKKDALLLIIEGFLSEIQKLETEKRELHDEISKLKEANTKFQYEFSINNKIISFGKRIGIV